jgi:hypothetical protein
MVESAWDKRACLPIQFGRDVRSGRVVQLGVYQVRETCAGWCDVVRYHLSVEVSFPEPFSVFECKCNGYKTTSLPHPDSICGPVVPGEPAFDVRHESGITDRMMFDTIDGNLVRGTDDLVLLAELPARLPGSIRAHDRAYSTELHFVTLEVARELARLGDELSAEWHANPGALCPLEKWESRDLGVLSLGQFKVYVRGHCAEPSIRGRAEAALRRAAANAKPRLVTTHMTAESCKALNELPREFFFRLDDKALELRYVDWLRR